MAWSALSIDRRAVAPRRWALFLVMGLGLVSACSSNQKGESICQPGTSGCATSVYANDSTQPATGATPGLASSSALNAGIVTAVTQPSPSPSPSPDPISPDSGGTGSDAATDTNTGTNTGTSSSTGTGTGTQTGVNYSATSTATGITASTYVSPDVAVDPVAFVGAPQSSTDGAPWVKLQLGIASKKITAYAALSHVDKVSNFQYQYAKDRYALNGTASPTGDFTGTTVQLPLLVAFDFDTHHCTIAAIVDFNERLFKPVCP